MYNIVLTESQYKALCEVLEDTEFYFGDEDVAGMCEAVTAAKTSKNEVDIPAK